MAHLLRAKNAIDVKKYLTPGNNILLRAGMEFELGYSVLRRF